MRQPIPKLLKSVGVAIMVGLGMITFLPAALAQGIAALPTDLAPIAASDIPSSVCNYYSIQNFPWWPPLPWNWLSASNVVLYVSPPLGANTIFVGDQDIDYAQQAAEAHVLDMAARAANGQLSPDNYSGIGTGMAVSFGYSTNDLWLELDSATNGQSGASASLLIHAPAPSVFDLFYAPTLPPPGRQGWYWIAHAQPGETSLVVSNLPGTAGFFILGTTNGPVDPATGLTAACMALVGPSALTNDLTGNGIPDIWEVTYFGSLMPATNYDAQGNTLLYDYNNGIVPVTFQFLSIATANNYFNTTQVPAQLVVAGWPYWIATLVDDTNLANASWTAFSSSNVTVNLGPNEGWHKVWIGLRGRADTADAAVWRSKRLKLDLTPPLLIVTNPLVSTVSVPLIQVQGYCPEPLQQISYDLTNALGLVANQPVWVLDHFYNTNTWEFTTNTFQAFDVRLTNGSNTLMIHATDLAGNAATASFTFILDYSAKTNPPRVRLYWPQDGTPVGNSGYTWRGWVEDPTVTVTAQLVDTNGDTNLFSGIVERDGDFWVENMSLMEGTNHLTLTVTDVVRNVATTNITVFPGPVALTITAPTPDQLWQQGITVNGTISDSTDYTVWVNGVQAMLNGDGTWTATNVWLPTGGTAVIQARAIPNSDNGGSGTGGGGGGAATYANLGNPNSAQATDAEMQTNKPSRLYVKSYDICDDLNYDSWYYDYAADGTFLQSGTVQSDRCMDLNWWDGQGGNGSESAQETWTLQVPGLDTTNSSQWLLQQTWPASWWPDLPDGTQVASGAYDWPYFTTNAGPAMVIQEHCAVTLPCGRSWNGVPHATFDIWYEDGEYRGVKTRSGDAVMKLQTGGKGLSSLQENIWQLSSWALQIFLMDTGMYLPIIAGTNQPVPMTNIWILGKPLGFDGNLYVVLPNNAEVDVTPYVPGVDYHIFGVNTQEYRLHIAANNIDLETNTPEFCVGQRVSLQATWDPALPPGTQTQVYWIYSLDFANTILPGNGDSSDQYVMDPTTYTNNPTGLWWYSDGLKQVWCQTTNTFPNGQVVTFRPFGDDVSVYRPEITDFEYFPPSYPTNWFDLGSLCLELGDLNSGGYMKYEVSVWSRYRGRAGVVQLIKRAANDAELGTRGDFWLDKQNPYSSSPVAREHETRYPFDDNPGVPDIYPDTTTITDTFIDYVVFRPSAGGQDNNIWITLGIVSGGNPSWAWSATSVPDLVGQTVYWNVQPGWSVTTPTWPDDSNAFPQWLHTLSY
jgi:hypothetical protein